ncbi:MAG: hypothetical protein GY869_24240 [Planctomycetes bacterium]|nr:hypothetical protein [Planctomycetota bacterium]
MANHSIENDLKRYYKQFEVDHELLRGQLISQLDQAQRPTAPRRLYLPPAVKRVIAAAACLMILFAGMYMLIGGDSSQDVYASTINKFSQLQSVHFKMNTLGSGEDAAIEMWWRRPHDMRMEVSNGTIITNNSDKRCIFNPLDTKQKLRIEEGSGGSAPEFSLLSLAGLDWLFTDDLPKLQDGIDKSVIKDYEAITYKGEACRRITCEKDGYLYVYIVDGLTKTEKQAPFYEVNVYGDLEATRLLSHMELLDVDADLPDDLFIIKE